MALPAEGGLADSKGRSEFHAALATVALLAGVPVLVALWALLSPALVLSREMTWDFVTISPAPGICCTAMWRMSTSTSLSVSSTLS